MLEAMKQESLRKKKGRSYGSFLIYTISWTVLFLVRSPTFDVSFFLPLE